MHAGHDELLVTPDASRVHTKWVISVVRHDAVVLSLGSEPDKAPPQPVTPRVLPIPPR
jgi:hypothetical protein